VNVRAVATWAPVVGAGLAAWLGWGLVNRREYWVASDFVLLFYATLLCVVAAHVAAALLRRHCFRPPALLARDLRFAVSLFAVLGVLWVWCAPLAEPVAGWWVRQVAMWKFGW